MRIRKLLAQAAIACTGHILLAHAAAAFDLTGVWVTDVDACDKVFVTEGNRTSFRPDADMHGSGFIIEGGHIRGRMASCNVTRTKENNGVIHMLTTCATDIMYHDVQFSVKVLDENSISRIFPGIDGMELTYHRCPSR